MMEASMMPSYHPEPEELLAYVSGAAEQWLATLIACHLTLCPACRDEVAMLDALGGALLEDTEDRVQVQAPRQHMRSAPPAALPTREISNALARHVPRPLHPYMLEPQPRFRFLAPGLAHVPLTLMGGSRPLQLVRFKPGFVVPEHGHSGLEWLLILSGELYDRTTGQRYTRGDVSRREAADVHSQQIGRTEPCVAVFANLQPLIPHTLLGKVLSRIVGL